MKYSLFKREHPTNESNFVGSVLPTFDYHWGARSYMTGKLNVSSSVTGGLSGVALFAASLLFSVANIFLFGLLSLFVGLRVYFTTKRKLIRRFHDIRANQFQPFLRANHPGMHFTTRELNRLLFGKPVSLLMNGISSVYEIAVSEDKRALLVAVKGNIKDGANMYSIPSYDDLKGQFFTLANWGDRKTFRIV